MNYRIAMTHCSLSLVVPKTITWQKLDLYLLPLPIHNCPFFFVFVELIFFYLICTVDASLLMLCFLRSTSDLVFFDLFSVEVES